LWQRYLQKILRYGLWHQVDLRKIFTRRGKIKNP